MLAYHQAQPDHEIADDTTAKLNDFGVLYWFLHLALTKCVILKFESQIRMTILEIETPYLLMRGVAVSFAFQIIQNIKTKTWTMSSIRYSITMHRIKESLPCNYLLTTFFDRVSVILAC